MTAVIEQRLETLEENVKSLPELLKEKDGNKALETKVQGIETAVKQLKVLVENSAKDVEVGDMELLGKGRGQLDDSENLSEEHKKPPGSNKIAVLNEIACSGDCVRLISSQEEIVVVTNRIPNALKRDNIFSSREIQENISFLDKATSPIKLMESKFEGRFALLVFSGKYMPAIYRYFTLYFTMVGNTKETILWFRGIFISLVVNINTD